MNYLIKTLKLPTKMFEVSIKSLLSIMIFLSIGKQNQFNLHNMRVRLLTYFIVLTILIRNMEVVLQRKLKLGNSALRIAYAKKNTKYINKVYRHIKNHTKSEYLHPNKNMRFLPTSISKNSLAYLIKGLSGCLWESTSIPNPVLHITSIV